MIPEFPMPQTDADFYRQQIYERPPLFGVLAQSMPNLTLADSASPISRISSAIDIQAAVEQCTEKLSRNHLTIPQSRLLSSTRAQSASTLSLIKSSARNALLSKLNPRLLQLT